MFFFRILAAPALHGSLLRCSWFILPLGLVLLYLRRTRWKLVSLAYSVPFLGLQCVLHVVVGTRDT